MLDNELSDPVIVWVGRVVILKVWTAQEFFFVWIQGADRVNPLHLESTDSVQVIHAGLLLGLRIWKLEIRLLLLASS